MKMARLAWCPTGLALALALSGAASAQDQTIDDYVRGRVFSIAQQVANSKDVDLVQVGDIMLGEIAKGQTLKYTFAIDPDKPYAVVGTCDSDCMDIDLLASDVSGKTVAEDPWSDPEAAILIYAGDAGSNLTVTVEMMLCDTDVCVVGVGLYQPAP